MMSRPLNSLDRGADEALGEVGRRDAADAGHGLAAGRRGWPRTVSSAGSASRSLTTMRAPSLASFSAIARPMPRPEPVMRATLPSSLRVMSCLPSLWVHQAARRALRRRCLVWPNWLALCSSMRTQRSPSCSSFSTTRPLQRIALPRCVMPRKRTSKRRSRLCGTQPVSSAAEPGHAQHAVREHVGHAGAAREVDVDVDRVVVARGAGEQRERGAVDRRQLQRRAARRRPARRRR